MVHRLLPAATRYVFICPTEQEASEWQERIRLAVCQVPPWVESALPSSRV